MINRNTNDKLTDEALAFAKPVLGDFVLFYKEQKEWDWLKCAMPKIIIEILRPHSEGGLYYEYAYFSGFVLRIRHNWKYSKVAKRNRHEYDYATVYKTQSGQIVTYHTYLGTSIYPFVDTLDDFA